MQFLISVINAGTGSATEAEMTAIDAFNDRLRAEGHWVIAGGLSSPSDSTVIDNRGGQGLVTDGPFAETKEYIAGFWVIEAVDIDEALKLSSEASLHCNRKVEVRALL